METNNITFGKDDFWKPVSEAWEACGDNQDAYRKHLSRRLEEFFVVERVCFYK